MSKNLCTFAADMKKKCFVFDLGGVIIDLDVPRCVAAFKALMGADNVRDILGMDDDGEGVVAVSAATKQLMHDFEYGNISPEEFVQRVQGYCYPGTTTEQIREAWMSMLGKIPAERLAFIASLRQKGYRTILLSNSNVIHWQAIFDQYHLDRYFDAIYASQELHMAKPNRDIYEYVVQAEGMEGVETVYIDDLEKNRKAGERFAGWKTFEKIPQIEQIEQIFL